MTDDKLTIKVILGSTRPNRFSEHAAAWITNIAKQRKELDVEVLDLRDYPMPFFDEPRSPSGLKREDYKNETVKKWWDKITEGDAFIVVAPEYNNSIAAVLKNAFDYVYAPWNKKAIGFVSYGSVGGGRSVQQLRQVAIELQMAATRGGVNIFAPWALLDEKGALKGGALDEYERSANGLLDQIIWWGNALKTARAQS